MPRKLSNIVVKFISLVTAGANGKEIILKSVGEGGKLLKTIALTKTDKVEKMVYGLVYAPGEVDSQGDFSTTDEIKKAAYLFMKSANVNNVDTQHNMQPVEAYVAESWIVKKGDPLFAEVGAWAVGIKIESDELWKKCESGEIGGLSLFGEAEAEADQTVEKSLIEKITENVMKAIGLKKDFNSELYTKEINDMIWTLQDAIWALSREDSTPEEKKAKVLENVTQFQAAVTNISKAGATLSQANLDKLKSAIEALTNVVNTATKPANEETDMKEEDVKKMIDDALAAQKEELAKSKNEEVEALKARIEVLEKAATGSASNSQDQGNNPETKDWL